MEDGKIQPSIFSSVLNAVVHSFCPHITFEGRVWWMTFHLSCNQVLWACLLMLIVILHTLFPAQDIRAQKSRGDHGI